MLALLVMTLVAHPGAPQDPSGKASAESLLRQIDNKKPPIYEESVDDAAYRKEWLFGYLRHLEHKNEMILEFVKAYPDHARAKPLMEEWFANLSGGTTPPINERIGKAIIEIDSLLIKNLPDWVSPLGKYWRAYYQLCGPWNRLIELDRLDAPAEDNERRSVITAGMGIIQEFVTRFPKEARAARLYDVLAEACHDPVSARSIYARVLADYPDHPNKPLFEAKMHRFDKIGEPFAFAFEDAATGEPVGSKQYEGKVLLVAFWAHEVFDSRKKLLDVKRLWFRYQSQGLEVVDISMDGTDLDRKKKYIDYVRDNHLDWHHYFQGGGIKSPFSYSWGVNSLPTYFLIDRKGILRYIDAEIGTTKKVQLLLKEK